MENNFKERIVENLKRHPEGLTILDIAEKTGINRVTVSKYVLVLSVEGMVAQIRVEMAELHCLK